MKYSVKFDKLYTTGKKILMLIKTQIKVALQKN